jgi:hypothetical protein
MKRSWIIAWIISLLFCAPSSGNESHEYIQHFDEGSINWTRWIIQSKGVGSLPIHNYNEDDARRLAQKKATETARENLLTIIYQVRVNATGSVEELAFSNTELTVKLKAMVNEAEVVKQEYLSDGTVEVTIEMPLYGGFAQMILPDEITQLDSIKPIVEKKATVLCSQESEVNMKNGKNKYTGLVINAIGLDAVPTMAPMVLDERGREVYGTAYVSREFAVQDGMCGYSRNLQSAVQNERVADNPLTVKGLRTNGPALTDIIISNADASKIWSSSDNLAFMRKCRVMIVLD